MSEFDYSVNKHKTMVTIQIILMKWNAKNTRHADFISQFYLGTTINFAE